MAPVWRSDFFTKGYMLLGDGEVGFKGVGSYEGKRFEGAHSHRTTDTVVSQRFRTF